MLIISSEYMCLKLTCAVHELLVQLIAVGCSVLLVHRYVDNEEVCGVNSLKLALQSREMCGHLVDLL